MQHIDIPVVKTERLILRSFTKADQPAYAAMRADPDVVRFLPGGEALVPFADEIATSRIESFREAWSRGHGVWAVEEASSGRLIGQAGLAKMERNADVEVLYALARDAWGHDYAREAAAACLRFGFQDREMSRIVAFVMPENIGSVRVLESIGLRRIGETTYNDFPVICYAITRDEFRMLANGDQQEETR